MKQYTYTHDGVEYKRVTKPIAKRAYDRGQTVCLCSDKVRPEALGVYVTKQDRDFEKVENEFAYYNCAPEMGARISYYISTAIELDDLFREDNKV